jgi:tellurite resistance protein TerC
MLGHDDDELHPDQNPVLRIFRRFFPVTPEYREHYFFVREAGRLFATPLFLVLLVVESSDVVFAVDSIPAIFAITEDPYIVFTSNIFAILGLRSLYFLLAGFVARFTYLKPSLAAVLVFVGGKMAAVDVVKLHPAVSLGVVVGILAIGIVASALAGRAKGRAGSVARPSEPGATPS